MSRTLLAIVFLIAALIVGFFYVWPQWTQFTDLGSHINDLTVASGPYDDVIKNRDVMLSSVNSISKDNLDRVDAALPLGSHAAEFLVVLESYTVAGGVTLKRVDVVTPSEEKKSSVSQQSQVAPAKPGASPVPSQPKPGTGESAGVSSGTQKDISELAFSIEVAGSYDALKKFISALEHNVRLIDVSEISFNAPGKDTNVIDLTLKAKTYYQ